MGKMDARVICGVNVCNHVDTSPLIEKEILFYNRSFHFEAQFPCLLKLELRCRRTDVERRHN